MSSNIYDIVSKTQFYDGKVLHQGLSAEKIHVWIFTLHHLMSNFEEGPYVPCARPTIFGVKSSAPACTLGRACFHVYLYTMLKNASMLWYSNTVTPDLYDNYYMKGVCGCPFRHSENELAEIDAEVKADIASGKFHSEVVSKLHALFHLNPNVDESIVHRGFACDVIGKRVGPLDFPHFFMKEIFISHVPVSDGIISEEDALAALTRLEVIKPKEPYWVESAPVAKSSPENFPELPMHLTASPPPYRLAPRRTKETVEQQRKPPPAYNATLVSSEEYFPVLPEPPRMSVPMPRSKYAPKDTSSSTSSNKAGTRKNIVTVRTSSVRPAPPSYVNPNPTVELVPIPEDAVRFF